MCYCIAFRSFDDKCSSSSAMKEVGRWGGGGRGGVGYTGDFTASKVYNTFTLKTF